MLDSGNMHEPIADPAPTQSALVRARIEASPDGISPVVDGRIRCVGKDYESQVPLPLNVQVAVQCRDLVTSQSADNVLLEKFGFTETNTDVTNPDAAKPKTATSRKLRPGINLP